VSAVRPVLFASYCPARAAWMVFSSAPGATVAEVHSGPYPTREAAEAALGPPSPTTTAIRGQ